MKPLTGRVALVTGASRAIGIGAAICRRLAAAGALETIVAINTLVESRIPPTRNHRNPDPEVNLDIVGNTARNADISIMTKHSFGLGGQNACLVLAKYLS